MIKNVIKNKIKQNPPPIWLMRQAGRYMSEYLSLRSKFSNFMDFCYSYENTAEVTLQPIRKFDFDAAIIFSDILVVPDTLGIDVDFIDGYGPKLSFDGNLDKLKESKHNEKFKCVSNAIKLTKQKLKNEGFQNKNLIGFSGSPFTLLTYILEDNRNNSFNKTRELIYKDGFYVDKLIDIIINQSVNYLSMQIESGVDLIQLFDSHAGVLNKNLYYKYIIEPTRRIVDIIKSKYDIQIIGFPKGSGYLYKDYVLNTKVDAISFDYLIDVKDFCDFGFDITIQGNLDPAILLSNKDEIKRNVDYILDVTKNMSFIFNLGHGILPNTPIENVDFLVKYIRSATLEENM